MKIIIMFFLFLFSIQATTLGTVKKIEGKAKLQGQDSMRKKSLEVGKELVAGDTVLTYRQSKVVLELNDKTKIVIDAFAKLTLLSADKFDQDGGKVYYKVTKRKGAKGLNVKTPFAIIGVKGTEFVITDDNNSKALSLNEGLVGVDSPDGKPFAHIDEDKVNAKLGTPSDVQAEFEAYKKELYAEFAEYVKSFDLKPGKKLVFNGKQVLESTSGIIEQQQFKLYMSDAEFNAISDELEQDVESGSKDSGDAFDDDFFSTEE